jgi:hypothetical protein
MIKLGIKLAAPKFGAVNCWILVHGGMTRMWSSPVHSRTRSSVLRTAPPSGAGVPWISGC